MYKMLLVFCVILGISTSVDAAPRKVKTFKPLAPMQTFASLTDPYQKEVGTNENYPKITQLEQVLFQKSFDKENIYSRLTRLENRVFRKSFTGMPLASRVENLLSNVDTGIMYGISPKEIAKIETKILGRPYPNEDTESRITRLEKEMLGAMQGGNLKERLETVKSASKHYNSYPEIVQNQQLYSPQGAYGYNPYNGYNTYNGARYARQSGLGNIMNNVMSRVFGGFGPGVLTGFTPPIYDPYSPYPQQGVGFQDYGTGIGHQHYRTRNNGAGSTIRILD